MCIGKCGCVICEMNIELKYPIKGVPGHLNCIAIVSGPAEGCENMQIIHCTIMEQYSPFLVTVAAFQSPHNSQKALLYKIDIE